MSRFNVMPRAYREAEQLRKMDILTAICVACFSVSLVCLALVLAYRIGVIL